MDIILDFSRAHEADDPHASPKGLEEYVLHTEGGGVDSAMIDWGDAEFTAALDALPHPDRDPALLQRVGDRLREALAPTAWRDHEREIVEAVGRGASVRVTIRSAAAELYALPWELLTNPATNQHLAELAGVSLQYAWPETETRPAAPSGTGVGRIVVAWSAAGGEVPAAEHIAAVNDAWAHSGFDPERDVVARVSPKALADALAAASLAEPIRVLHILCHGAARGAGYGLAWNPDDPEPGGHRRGASAGPRVIDAGRLRQIVAPHADQLRLVVLSACDSGNPGEPGDRLGSVAQNLHRVGIEAVVASRYPLSWDGSVGFARTFYRELLGVPASVEAAFSAARRALTTATAGLDWASLQLYARPEDGGDTRPLAIDPYRGLLSFGVEHARFYFGREAEGAEVVADLRALAAGDEPRFLVVAGASGTGKSSLLRAWVIPRLMTDHQVVDMRPGRTARDELAALGRSRTGDAEPAADPERSVVVVVDQFEELFTGAWAADEREAFVRELWELASRPGGPICIVALRVDFVGRCGEITLDDRGLRLDRVAYDESHRVFVAQMHRDQLRRVIEEPARKAGSSFEAGLVDRILDDIEGEPGALPLVQHTLHLLWQKRRDRVLTAAAYQELGGVSGALEKHADQLIESLDEPGRRAARRLLVRLVNLEDDALATRRRVAVSDLRPDRAIREDGRADAEAVEVARREFDRVVEALVSSRLLVRGEEGGEATLEVAHEALIRRWDRLHRWLGEDRARLFEIEKLARWTGAWREFDTLLTGGQLGYATEVRDRGPEDLPPEALQMIVASVDAETRLRRRSRRRLHLALAAALAITAAMGVLSWLAWRGSRDARVEAERARYRALVSAAARLVDSDPTTAASVLREVADPRGVHGWLALAARTLHDPVSVAIWRGHESTIDAAALSPDGTRVAIGADDGSLRVWSVHGDTVTLIGRGREVRQVAFSPDGTRLVAGFNDRFARLFASDGTGVEVTLPHLAPVAAVGFSPDGTRVFTGSRDHTIRVWTVDGSRSIEPDGPAVRSIEPDGPAVRSIEPDGPAVRSTGRSAPEVRSIAVLGGDSAVTVASFSGDGTRIVAGYADGTARVWPADGSSEPVVLRGHAKEINEVALDPDGGLVATASEDGTLRLWRASGEPVTSAEHGDPVRSVAFSPDGRTLVTATASGYVFHWAIIDGNTLMRMSVLSARGSNARFSPDGTQVLVYGDVVAWVEAVDGPRRVLRLTGHASSTAAAGFSADGHHVFTASRDGTARVWRTRSAERMLLGQPPYRQSYVVARFTPDGSRIVTTSADGTARVWPAGGGEPMVLAGHTGPVTDADVSPDSTRVVTGSHDRTARVWPLDGGEPRVLPGHDAWIVDVAFSPDGTRVATASQDRTARVWSLASEGEPIVLAGHTSVVNSVAWSDDGTRVVTASEDHTARVWDLENGARSVLLEGHTGPVAAAAFSPDGTRVVTVSDDRTARVYPSDGTGAPVVFEDHESAIRAVAFSPDGTLVATGSGDGTARIRRADGTGESVLLSHGPRHQLTAVAFSPDGTRLLTGSNRGVKMWSVDGQDEPVDWPTESNVVSLAFSPDGTRVVCGFGDNHARVWIVDPERLRQAMWQATTNCATVAERRRYLGEDTERAERNRRQCEQRVERVSSEPNER